MIKHLTYLLLLAGAFNASALTVDTMLLVADEGGNGAFSLTNELQQTSFIKGSISQIDVVDGEIRETKYTEDNFEDWEITLTHPKLILESGRSKFVGVRSLCGKQCTFESDHVYKVLFEPSPYDPDGQNESSVTINFGYAPLFVIPAKEPNVEYTIDNYGDQFYINNTGNTYIRVAVDECSEEVFEKCKATFTVLAGRKRYFDLPDAAQNKDVEVIVVNHDESYKQRRTVQQQQ